MSTVLGEVQTLRTKGRSFGFVKRAEIVAAHQVVGIVFVVVVFVELLRVNAARTMTRFAARVDAVSKEGRFVWAVATEVGLDVVTVFARDRADGFGSVGTFSVDTGGSKPFTVGQPFRPTH